MRSHMREAEASRGAATCPWGRRKCPRSRRRPTLLVVGVKRQFKESPAPGAVPDLKHIAHACFATGHIARPEARHPLHEAIGLLTCSAGRGLKTASCPRPALRPRMRPDATRRNPVQPGATRCNPIAEPPTADSTLRLLVSSWRSSGEIVRAMGWEMWVTEVGGRWRLEWM